jgi:hypothetical protein
MFLQNVKRTPGQRTSLSVVVCRTSCQGSMDRSIFYSAGFPEITRSYLVQAPQEMSEVAKRDTEAQLGPG